MNLKATILNEKSQTKNKLYISLHQFNTIGNENKSDRISRSLSSQWFRVRQDDLIRYFSESVGRT